MSDPRSLKGEQEKNELTKLYVTSAYFLSANWYASIRRIYSHGGNCVQIVRESPVLVIYGGKTTRTSYILPVHTLDWLIAKQAYDLKLIMNKDTHDVITPDWVRESVQKHQLVPFRKKLVQPLSTSTFSVLIFH